MTTMPAIQSLVARASGLVSADMTSMDRGMRFAIPREIAMYLCREMTRNSFQQIGVAFGGRHNSTVQHGVAHIAAMIADAPYFAAHVRMMREQLAAGIDTRKELV